MYRTLLCLLLGALLAGCGGPYMVERVDIQDGMVVGEQQILVDGDNQVIGIRQDGYVPDSPYLDGYRDGGVDLGPNAPGYVP